MYLVDITPRPERRHGTDYPVTLVAPKVMAIPGHANKMMRAPASRLTRRHPTACAYWRADPGGVTSPGRRTDRPSNLG
jgi:hypothetical protein